MAISNVEGTISFNSDELSQKRLELKNIFIKMESDFDQINRFGSFINSSFWDGPANDDFTDQYNIIKNNIKAIKDTIQNIWQLLDTTVDTVKNVESDLMNKANNIFK